MSGVPQPASLLVILIPVGSRSPSQASPATPDGSKRSPTLFLDRSQRGDRRSICGPDVRMELGLSTAGCLPSVPCLGAFVCESPLELPLPLCTASERQSAHAPNHTPEWLCPGHRLAGVFAKDFQCPIAHGPRAGVLLPCGLPL